MILVDPDLKPDLKPDREADPARGAARVKPSTPPAQVQSRNSRLPSARALARFLSRAQAAVRLRCEVTVLLTTDAALRRLNRRFRSIDKTTDVLSFPAAHLVQNQGKNAGDLAISVETARRQGTACGHSLGTEIKVLILHGLLHLAGYDHESDAGRMARREKLLRARLGLPAGLIERASVFPHRQPRRQARGSEHAAKKATADPSARLLRSLAQDDKPAAGKRTARRRRP
jgi:probable rRNA maturation factor